MSQCFKLYDNYILRGWADLPNVLFDRNTLQGNLISEFEMQTINLAAGGIPVDSFLFTQKHKDIIKQLLDNKYGELVDIPVALTADQKFHSTRANTVQNLHWSITGRCNLKCRHCYIDAPDSLYGELSTSQIDTILEQLSDANIMALSITGGEPLIRKDFFEFYQKILDRKISVSAIYTNGLLVTEKWLEKFESIEKNKLTFSISFDGIGCHDWVRNRKGMEQRALDAIKLLKKHGFPVEIETAVYRDNLDALLPTYELFKELGIDIWKFSVMQESKAWSKHSQEHGLSSEILAYDTYTALLRRFTQDNRPFMLQIGGIYLFDGQKSHCLVKRGNGKEECATNPLCSCARIHPYLLPDGTLLPCMPMSNCEFEADMPNVFKQPLEAILSKNSDYFNFISMSVKDMFEKHPSPCSTCEHRYVCLGGCRAFAMKQGNIYGPDINCCRFLKGNYFEKFKEFFD